MIAGLALLLLCQLVGEVISRGLGMPVPGPVLGLVLLFAGLMATERLQKAGNAVDDAVAPVADGLLGNLALLFVPAGVGVIRHLDVFAAHGPAIGLALVGSTALTLVVTVVVFVMVAEKTAASGDRV
jgi:putative effector of murein hydrolase LrgA (UPF0299 family)